MKTLRQVGPSFRWDFAMALALVALLVGGTISGIFADSDSNAARIRFSKRFKEGDMVSYTVSLDLLGRGKYEATPRSGDAISRDIEASAETMRQLMAAFDGLGFLTSDQNYESRAKVADMGWKTVTLEQNGRARTVEFNYTTNAPMIRIDSLLEGLAATAYRLNSVEMKMKYDKLGLPNELSWLEAELKNQWLTDPQMLLSALRKIAGNTTYFNIVQRKADQLILQIESGKTSSRKD